MAYTLKTNIADRGNYGAKRTTANIKWIAVHYTGNDGDTDERNGQYFHNNVVKSSAHYFVDDDSVTQSVPDNYTAWAVGGNKYSNCDKTGGGKCYGQCKNGNSISIELCDDVKNGIVYPSAGTIANAVELCKALMKKYNIPQSNVIRHFDVNGKPCPAYWCGSADNNKKWETEFWDKLTEEKKATTAASASSYTKKQFITDVQKTTGSTVDGIAGPKTLAKTVTVSATKNRKHAVVKPLQKWLNSLGYNCGTADGIAGAKFTNAVNAYQSKTLGYKNPDGEITAGGKMWRKLLGMD